jgi:hypothetical protein
MPLLLLCMALCACLTNSRGKTPQFDCCCGGFIAQRVGKKNTNNSVKVVSVMKTPTGKRS